MLPLLWLIPMPQRMTTKEEVVFWHVLDLEIGEDLELGVPPPDIWLKDVGWQLWLGPEP